MAEIIKLLKEFLPLEIALIAIVFLYFLILFKNIAEKFISIAEKQTSLAETQAKYIQERLNVVEKTLGISDKAFDLQEKRIKTLEELDRQRQVELNQSQIEVDEARENLERMKLQYYAAIASLNLQTRQVEDIESSQHLLQQASRTEAVVVFNHRLQTKLQVAIARADNLKNELPEDSNVQGYIEEILTDLEGISLTAMTLTEGDDKVEQNP